MVASRAALKRIIEDRQSPEGRVFFLMIQLLILVSIVAFSIETVPDLSPSSIFWLRALEIVTVFIFSIEYALRILVADSRLKYIFSFYGLVDLLAIIPFYVSAGVDLRVLRIFRFFRVFRVFKILRYTKAMQRLTYAVSSVKDELVVHLIATAMLIYLASVGIYYFESEKQPEQFGSIFHCLWWAVVTMTTVGYGDAYPVTIGGRIFTTAVVIVGIGTVAVPTGLIASALGKEHVVGRAEFDLERQG